MLFLLFFVVVFCYSCVAPTFSFKLNKEVLDVTNLEMALYSGICTVSEVAVYAHPLWRTKGP